MRVGLPGRAERPTRDTVAATIVRSCEGPAPGGLAALVVAPDNAQRSDIPIRRLEPDIAPLVAKTTR
jgi:hypothetical protein